MFSECSDNVYVGSATTKQSIVQAKLFSIPFNIVICSLDNYCNMSSGPSQQRKTTHAFLYQPWLRRKHGEIRNANGQGSSCNTGSMPTNDKDIYQDNLFLYNIFQGFITSCPLQAGCLWVAAAREREVNCFVTAGRGINSDSSGHAGPGQSGLQHPLYISTLQF